jgi:hypothetical protein
MLSFSLEEFLMILERYNLIVWPMQILAYFFGILALVFVFKKNKYSNQIILTVLSLYWLWNGIIFCPIFWAPTYNFAYLFAAFCIIQGILFIIAIFKCNISFGLYSNLYTIIGIVFIIYAMVGYLIFGYFLGHVYPKFFPFGLVPCPTTILTFGLFLLTDKKVPRYYLIVPFIIALGGFLAAYKGVLEDIGLIIAGFLGTYLLLQRDKNTDQ